MTGFRISLNVAMRKGKKDLGFYIIPDNPIDTCLSGGNWVAKYGFGSVAERLNALVLKTSKGL